MRTIEVDQITQAIAKMCIDACYYLSEDVYEALVSAGHKEESSLGKEIIGKIVENANISKNEDRPICQDTGMAVVFMEIGQDVHIVGGSLEDAVNAGVAKGYTEGYLRKSVVAEPLFNGNSHRGNRRLRPGASRRRLPARRADHA